MKQVFSFFKLTLIILICTVYRVDAQPDSQNRVHDVEINTQGDTLVVIYHDGTESDSTHRRLRIEREITIDADGDTTIVTDLVSPPRMRGRRHKAGPGRYVNHKRIRLRHPSDHSISSDDVEINSQGDTLMIIHHGDGEFIMPKRRMQIERELRIDSDGDTTMVTELVRPSRMRGRRHHQRYRRHRGSPHQHSHPRFRHQIHHSDHHPSEDEITLQQMEKKARELASEVRGAHEDSYAEKREALRVQLHKIFDFKHEIKSKQLTRQRLELDTQTQSMEERHNNREIIIEDRMNQILGRGSSYHW